MNKRLLKREKYESYALNDHSNWQELDFFEFIARSPYDDSDPRKDTFYDGDLYCISINNLICWDETTLTLKILGPFWDRVFRAVFQEVTCLKFKEKRASSFAYIYSVKLKNCSKNKCKYKCTIRDFHKNKILQFKFNNVVLLKAILKESIKREDF